MESLLLAAGLVVPMTVYMLVGFFIRRAGILEDTDFKKLNSMIFKILIPLSVFFELYQCDLQTAAQPRLFVMVAAGIILVCAVCWCIVPRLTGERRDAATIVQGIYRSNYVLFGTTIGLSLCGEQGAAVTAALVVVTVPLFNALAVILFETARNSTANPKKLLIGILKNPLILAVATGAVCNLLRVPLPELLVSPLEKLGSTASPLALVVLGGMLSLQSISGHKKYLTGAVLGRLVIVPLLMLSVFALCGYRGPELVAVLAVFGSPAAVSSTPMAQAMGGNGKLAGEIVALSSVCSILTLFCFVVALVQMGLI